jgi:hypothetical protein
MTRARNTRSTNSRRRTTSDSVREAITDFRSHIEDCDEEAFRLIDLAAPCMAKAAWLFDGELEPEEVCSTPAGGGLVLI